MDRELKGVLILNYIVIIGTNLSSILLTPFLKNGLGMTQYGLYTLAFSVFCFFSIADFGIGSTVVRNVTKYRFLGESKAQENFLFSSLVVFVSFSLISTALCAGIHLSAGMIFRDQMDAAAIGRFRLLFGILTANAFLMFYQNYFFSIISGYEKYIFAKSVFLVRLVVRTVLIPVFMVRGLSAAWVFSLDLILTALTVAAFIVYCFVVCKPVIRFHFWDRAQLGKLYSRTFLLYFAIVTENTFWFETSMLLAAFCETWTVGVFSIALTFSQIFTQLSFTIVGYFLPEATKMVVDEAPASVMTAKMIAVGRPVAMLLTFIIVGFLTIGKDFLTLWMGPEFLPAYPIAAVILCVQLFQQTELFGETLMQARNQYGFRMLSFLLSALTCLGINVVLLPRLGLAYSWVGITVSFVLYRTLMMNYAYRRLGLSIASFFKQVYARLLPAAGAAGVFCVFIARIDVPNVWMLGLKGLLVAAAYAAAIWLICLNQADRRMLLDKLPRR